MVNASPNGRKVTRATIRVALLLVRGKIPTLEGLSCWLAGWLAASPGGERAAAKHSVLGASSATVPAESSEPPLAVLSSFGAIKNCH